MRFGIGGVQSQSLLIPGNCAFETSAERAPSKVNQENRNRDGHQTEVSARIRRVNSPLWINKSELRRPKYFAQVKPGRPTRDQDSIDQAERRQHTGALMIFLPPDRQQPAAESKKEERGDFEKRAAGDAMFSQPKNQQQGSRQCASGRL